MLKQTVVSGLAEAKPQEVVLDLERVASEIANAEQKKGLSLESVHTYAFQQVYEQNPLLLNQRLKSNQESAKQFDKPTISVPNIVLNSFYQLKQDSLPLVVAMFAQVYNQVERYTDELAKALKDHAATSDAVKAVIATNPIEKNYFFLPYQLVRTLLNFGSISDDFEADKFGRATNELRTFCFRLYFNRRTDNEIGEQINLLTTFMGKERDLDDHSVEINAFENCFYWQNKKKEFLGFTIGAEFRKLLLMLMSEMKDGAKLRQILPYTRVDWHFLHYLPQRNNLRQMYLFIKSNIYNNSVLREQASFEYSLDELKRFVGVVQDSHYADNDAHFVRDKIRNVVADLSKMPGCEYSIDISTRSTKTPSGLKQKLVKFNVVIKRTFTDSHKAILRHIRATTNVSNFKNDWLIFSCIRYCTVEQLCARIDSAYSKFVGIQKNVGLSKKYDHLTTETQISRFLSDDLQKYWQELAASMLIENRYSSYSRLVKKVVVEDTGQSASKIVSSPAAQIVQSKKRGRPPKDPTKVTMPKLSPKEKKMLNVYNKKIEAEKLKAKKENTQVVQSESESMEPPVQNVIVFPKEHVFSDAEKMADEVAQATAENLETDYRIDADAPANFSAPPPVVDDSQWETYSENEISLAVNRDVFDLESFETFIINGDNLIEHLQPVNGNTDHYLWVNDYLEHMNVDHQSDANSLFYDLFNLTAIFNIIEHNNKLFQSRNVKCIDLYREKLNIVFQTLFKFYGTYKQRNDQASAYGYLVEKTAEFLFESSEFSPDQRIFTRALFVQLAKTVKTEKKISTKEFYSLRGQCVAYPFSE